AASLNDASPRWVEHRLSSTILDDHSSIPIDPPPRPSPNARRRFSARRFCGPGERELKVRQPLPESGFSRPSLKDAFPRWVGHRFSSAVWL
ncbi:MAG TPA: hypothetical protein VMT56_04180, partial [Candidatus Bathyarchaeia archaeon]|nr:hypothetical protein [Candidatus Bathyarchaeia archaeon]